jgi:hypothetical protein
MQNQKNKRIGLAIMCVFGAAFVFFFWCFGLSGAQINGNPSLLLEGFFTAALLPIGLYSGLYFAVGKKVALQLGGGLALLLVIAFLIGLFFHH